MALELFKPFVYHELEKRNLASTIKMAKELVEQQTPEVCNVFEGASRDSLSCSTAPSHRRQFQALSWSSLQGKAIEDPPPPWPGAPYNADFDGDQWWCTCRCRRKAQASKRSIALSTRNILSPASGCPLAVPSQDMVIGVYYLTTENPTARGAGKTFASMEEVYLAHAAGLLGTQAPVQLRFGLVDRPGGAGSSQDPLHSDTIEVDNMLLETTVGRVLFNMQLPKAMPFINGQLKKKGLQNLVAYSFMHMGHEATVRLLDDLKEIGFHYDRFRPGRPVATWSCRSARRSCSTRPTSTWPRSSDSGPRA